MQDEFDEIELAEIGRPEGKAPHSGYGEEYYDKIRNKRDALSTSEVILVNAPRSDMPLNINGERLVAPFRRHR